MTPRENELIEKLDKITDATLALVEAVRRQTAAAGRHTGEIERTRHDVEAFAAQVQAEVRAIGERLAVIVDRVGGVASHVDEFGKEISKVTDMRGKAGSSAPPPGNVYVGFFGAKIPVSSRLIWRVVLAVGGAIGGGAAIEAWHHWFHAVQ